MKYGIYTMIAICLLSCIKENKGDTHIVEDTVWEIDFLDILTLSIPIMAGSTYLGQ